jgi:hypothetical protein
MYYRLSHIWNPLINKPGFTVPLFSGEKRYFIQDLRDHQIAGFTSVELESDAGLRAVRESIEISVGDEELVSFSTLEDHEIMGSRRAIAERLKPVARKYLARPFLCLEIAQFLGDRSLEEAAVKRISEIESNFSPTRIRKGEKEEHLLNYKAEYPWEALVTENAAEEGQVGEAFEIVELILKEGVGSTSPLAAATGALLSGGTKLYEGNSIPYPFSYWELYARSWREIDPLRPMFDGLYQILSRLAAVGAGPVVDSWIGGGSKQPVQPHYLGSAIGQNALSELSVRSGLTQQEVLNELVIVLPQLVNELAPTDGITMARELHYTHDDTNDVHVYRKDNGFVLKIRTHLVPFSNSLTRAR